MNKIKILPEKIVNQIAAGEVVERPASVVKELVENSLDAGASFIEINIDKGGKEKIKIRDNGQGMSRQNAQLAVKRYSTSKIKSIDDLNQINTFGFRGEALASIASVSKFNLKTKTAGSVEGTELIIQGSKKPAIQTCGHPSGTTITVEDLFFNIPARQKFLKTSQTEFKHIRDFVTAQAICHPKTGFRLIHNSREIFNLAENKTITDRLINLLNLDLDQFSTIEIKADYFNLKGFVGLPETARKKQSIQYLFINQRYLSNKTVSGAIYKAYRQLLPSGIKPAYILKLNVRQDLIDVNVHPRKEEIKFISPGIIFETVYKAISSKISQTAENHKNVYQTPKIKADQSKIFSQPKIYKNQPTYTDKEKFIKAIFEDKEETYTGINESEIWQINNLYLIVPDVDGLIIYDQHAAEERILFEEFKTNFKSKQGTSQELMFDEEIKLTPQDVNLVKKHQAILETIGFKFTIGENLIKVGAVPIILKDKNIDMIIKDYLDELKDPEEDFDFDSNQPPGIDVQSLTSLAYLACRAAVKQGDKLIPRKRQEIIDKINNLGSKGLTCPHGRPTRIKINLNELNKRFHRS